jgi:MoaA/NifB/PqqE/SkfB family radical SAM enzyme
MRSDMVFAARHGVNHVAQRLSYRFDRPIGKPSQVTVLLTNACSARCVMCDIWKMQAENELDVEEWKEVVDQLREWLGPFFLVISGGEPFQKRGIFDLLEHCRAVDVKTKISSNGMYLTEKACDRILEVGPDFLSLSIDHHRREVHDELRGVPLFDRCVSAIEYLHGHGDRLVLGVASIIMEETYRDLVETAQWALGLGVDRVLFQPLYPTFASDEGMDPEWFERNPHWPRDPDALRDVLERLRTMKASGEPIWNADEQLLAMEYYFRDPASHPRPDECMVRYSTFNIDAHGDVNFCWTVDDSLGNVLEVHPREMWSSALASQVRAKMRYCKAPCLLNCYRGRSVREQLALFRLFFHRQGF